MTEEIKKRPILTIAIPTYNRAMFLQKCLANIYSQIGDDPSVEVLVCNNCSVDDTEEILKMYKKMYKNIIYFKNESNIGASRNIQKVLELSNGEYINLHGDDDYFNDGIYREIIKMIDSNRDCDLMYLTMNPNDLILRRGKGMSSYQIDSGTGGWITGMIINNDAYKKIQEKEKFLYSNLNHIYIQLELLRTNPNYCVLSTNINRADTGSAGSGGYNIIEVAIKNYLDILYSFKNNGLTEEELAYHKKFSLDITFRLIYWIIQRRLPITMDRAVEIFTEYYSEEPYFDTKLAELKGIVALRVY